MHSSWRLKARRLYGYLETALQGAFTRGGHLFYMDRAIVLNKWTRVWILTALAALPLIASPLPGTVSVYGNLGPGDSYQTGFGDNWEIGGPAEVIAETFTTSTTIQFADAQLALDAPGSYTSINVYLESGPYFPMQALEPDTTILDTLVQHSPMTDPASLITFACSSCPILSPGTTYWIVAAPTGNPYLAAWQTNNTGADGVLSDNGSTTGPWDNSQFGTSAAFEVDGIPVSSVPEPGSTALFVTGIAALLVSLALRHKSKIAL